MYLVLPKHDIRLAKAQRRPRLLDLLPRITLHNARLSNLLPIPITKLPRRHPHLKHVRTPPRDLR